MTCLERAEKEKRKEKRKTLNWTEQKLDTRKKNFKVWSYQFKIVVTISIHPNLSRTAQQKKLKFIKFDFFKNIVKVKFKRNMKKILQ